jgi:cytochrome P450
MGAKQILGEDNIAFMTGEPHKNLRKKILPLFTPRALSIFLKVQGIAQNPKKRSHYLIRDLHS